MPQSIIWRGSTSLVEQADSPQWTYGEEIVALARYKGPTAVCVSNLVPKGTSGSGVFAGLVVESSRTIPEKGGLAALEISYKGIPTGASGGPAAVTQVPADEYDFQPNEEELAIETHPRYASLATSYIDGTSELDLVRLATNAGSGDERSSALDMLTTHDLALELFGKIQKGKTHFLYPAPIYIWTLFFISQPTIDLGGYPESPTGAMIEPAGFTWLRVADSLTWTGIFWRLQRRWFGSLVVDFDLYPVT